MTLWGDPSALQRMASAFYEGQATGMYVQGLDRSIPPEVKQAAVTGATAIGQTLGNVVRKIVGTDTPPAAADDGRHGETEVAAAEPKPETRRSEKGDKRSNA